MLKYITTNENFVTFYYMEKQRKKCQKFSFTTAFKGEKRDRDRGEYYLAAKHKVPPVIL